MAMGTSLSNAASPTPAWRARTNTTSSVAYAVEEIASDAKIGRATRLRSRWWPSSDVAMGRPIRIRLASDTISMATIRGVGGAAPHAVRGGRADLHSGRARRHRRLWSGRLVIGPGPH